MEMEKSPIDSAPPTEVAIDPEDSRESSSDKTITSPVQIPKDSQSIQIAAQTITDRALHFLSTASNETLGACIVGLSAATYLVLGRFGLVLIGVVGGVVLQATWEGSRGRGGSSAPSSEERRKETGLEVVSRILKWRSQGSGDSHAESDDNFDLVVKLSSGEILDFSDFQPEIASALNELTDAVIRDYVKWWYSPVLPGEDSFPSSCRQTLTAFILSASSHLSRKRPADAFLDFLTNSSSIIIVFLNELCAALNASPNSSAAKAVSIYLETKPDSNLANVLDTKHQSRKLGMVAEDILQNYLDFKTYNCRAAHVFLQEIMSKLIIEMTIQKCSRPEWINEWIVYLLEDGEPELMNVIDAGVEGSAGQKLENVKAQVLASEQARAKAEEEQNASNDEESIAKHKRTVSRAQEAMDEAMKEAQRLTQMIAEEDEKRVREQEQQKSTTSLSDSISGISETTNTTQGVPTPASSQDGSNDDGELAGLKIHGVETASPTPEEPPTAAQPVATEPKQPFTSFDQFVPPSQLTALSDALEKKESPPPLTLHNANMAIFDDAAPNDRSLIRNKPNVEYLIQIEPKSSHYAGWMIARKYADFETLHEILKRISVISGITGFTESHAQLPTWKTHTKASLRDALERYLNAAVSYKPLADSEGMKRFFEKDNLARTGSGKGGFPGLGWPTPQAFENMGKGMINVLTSAPKDVAGGGKALFGGVTGAIGGALGPKKANAPATSPGRPNGASHQRNESIVPPLPEIEPRGRSISTVSPLPQLGRKDSEGLRKSQDSLRPGPIVDTQPTPVPQMERRPSYEPQSRPSTSSRRSSVFGISSRDHSRAPSVRSVHDSADLSPVMGGDQILNLPPPPTEIADDFTFNPSSAPLSPLRREYDPENIASVSKPATGSPEPKPRAPAPPKPPISEQETQVAVELLFAIITELYTLSSAWNIRKTLLTAAKTFLLRPGNPQLESLRTLLQETVLDANTSPAGLAEHFRKLRANTLPTAEELKAWPEPMTEREKEKLRVKARKLLVERGMPVALTGVMGQAATGEALGKIFDCLQVESVARGLMFGLVLQAARGITH